MGIESSPPASTSGARGGGIGGENSPPASTNGARERIGGECLHLQPQLVVLGDRERGRESSNPASTSGATESDQGIESSPPASTSGARGRHRGRVCTSSLN